MMYFQGCALRVLRYTFYIYIYIILSSEGFLFSLVTQFC